MVLFEGQAVEQEQRRTLLLVPFGKMRRCVFFIYFLLLRFRIKKTRFVYRTCSFFVSSVSSSLSLLLSLSLPLHPPLLPQAQSIGIEVAMEMVVEENLLREVVVEILVEEVLKESVTVRNF